jgi:hypothetical protein
MYQPGSVDRLRIAALATVCERSVTRVYLGGGREQTHTRVMQAALALGLPPPPPREQKLAQAA